MVRRRQQRLRPVQLRLRLLLLALPSRLHRLELRLGLKRKRAWMGSTKMVKKVKLNLRALSRKSVLLSLVPLLPQ